MSDVTIFVAKDEEPVEEHPIRFGGETYGSYYDDRGLQVNLTHLKDQGVDKVIVYAGAHVPGSIEWDTFIAEKILEPGSDATGESHGFNLRVHHNIESI